MVKLPFFIAFRYLLSKKKTNVINVISAISVLGVAVSTMALIVILSVFNGLNGLIKSLFNSFDPDLKITLKEGKNFVLDNEQLLKIKNLDGVLAVSEVLEENALLEYTDKPHIGTIKGVDSNFIQVSGIDTMLIDGTYKLTDGKNNFTIVGYEIAHFLSIGLRIMKPISVYVPNRNSELTMLSKDAFNQKYIIPSGIFSIQKEYNSKYIIVPISFARDLLQYENELSALEIKLSQNLSDSKKTTIQKKIQNIAGERFNVKNRFEQQELLYKIMESEKWAIFLILGFIIFIASFNILGALTMLIMDKKKDIYTLRSLGANNQLLKKIFLTEGWLISILGAVIGLFLGTILCLIQINFGIVPFPKNFLISNYPVEMQFFDYIFVFIIVISIGFLAAYYPVGHISKKNKKQT